MSKAYDPKVTAQSRGHHQRALMELNPTDARIAELLSEGRTQTEVAAIVGVTRETVCKKWNGDVQLRQATRLLAAPRIHDGLRRTSVTLDKALKKIEALLDSDDETVALRAAAMILSAAERCESALQWSTLEEVIQATNSNGADR